MSTDIEETSQRKKEVFEAILNDNLYCLGQLKNRLALHQIEFIRSLRSIALLYNNILTRENIEFILFKFTNCDKRFDFEELISSQIKQNIDLL